MVWTQMVNRRGLPLEVLSENGTNIVGGNTELKELINNLEEDKIKTLGNDGYKNGYLRYLKGENGTKSKEI